MTCIHRTYLGQRWLKLRKERGTTACSEKARSVETVCGAESQDKTCMAKAILPEPQSAAAYTLGGVAERLTRRTGWTDDMMFRSSAGHGSDVEAHGEPACPAHPLYGGASGRTGRLTTSLLLIRVITGWPTAGGGASRRPVWPRSRHSTRTPGVTAGTAAARRTDRGHKRRATAVNTRVAGGRAAAFTIHISTTEAC
jgi:hypothetical protein